MMPMPIHLLFSPYELRALFTFFPFFVFDKLYVSQKNLLINLKFVYKMDFQTEILFLKIKFGQINSREVFFLILMQKRHRRSIQQKEMVDNEERGKVLKKRQSEGTYYPDLFADEGEEKQIGWKFRLSESCPAAYSSAEDQDEDEWNDEEEEESEGILSRRGQARRLGSQSLPLDASRSRSSDRGQKTPSPIQGEKTKQPKQKGFADYFQENLSQTPIEYNQLISCTVIIVIIIFACLFVFPIFIARRQMTPEEQFLNFKKDLKKLIDQEMPANDNKDKIRMERRTQSWKVLIYVADKMLRRNQQHEENEDQLGEKGVDLDRLGPMILLIAGKDGAKVDRVSEQFGGILRGNWPNYGLLSRSFDSSMTKMGMEKEVLEPILGRQRIKPEMLLLHLKGIDKLRQTSPLFLHSLADPESSPLLQTPHNIFIVGTIQLAVNLKDEGTMNCSELIENSLLQSWQSEALSIDQIHPIISRISAHAICLD